jgi:hypothetical protein
MSTVAVLVRSNGKKKINADQLCALSYIYIYLFIYLIIYIVTF